VAIITLCCSHACSLPSALISAPLLYPHRSKGAADEELLNPAQGLFVSSGLCSPHGTAEPTQSGIAVLAGEKQTAVHFHLV